MSRPKVVLFVPCGGMWNALTTACLISLGINPEQFDMIIGCSSSVGGISYWMAGQYEEVENSWVNKMTHFRVFHWLKLVFLFSIFKRWGLYAADVDYLIDHCCDDLHRDSVCRHGKLRAIVYDVATATTEFLTMTRAVFDLGSKASAAIPGLARRETIDGHEKVDGGTANPLPIEHILGYAGSDCRLVVVLNHARDYHPTPVKRWQAWCAFPDPHETHAREAILHRHEQHSRSMKLLEQLECDGKAVVVAPEYSPSIHFLSRCRESVRLIWECGRLLGQVHRERVHQFLSE